MIKKKTITWKKMKKGWKGATSLLPKSKANLVKKALKLKGYKARIQKRKAGYLVKTKK